MRYKLVDAREMHKRHPKTFEVPTEQEILMLQIGDNVKLCFNELERMWVKITRIIDMDHFEGTLDNDPVNTPGIKYGDSVKFSYKNIYSIFEE